MIIIIKQYKVSVDNLKERVFFLKINKKKKIYPGGKLVVGYIYIYICKYFDRWMINIRKYLFNASFKNFIQFEN